MAPPASYLVAVLCCICVLLTSNIVPSFSLPGFALRHRDLNPPPNVIGPFLERKDVVREDTEEDGSGLGAEFLDAASTTTESGSSQRRTSSTRVVPPPRSTTSVRRFAPTTSAGALSSTSVFPPPQQSSCRHSVKASCSFTMTASTAVAPGGPAELNQRTGTYYLTQCNLLTLFPTFSLGDPVAKTEISSLLGTGLSPTLDSTPGNYDNTWVDQLLVQGWYIAV